MYKIVIFALVLMLVIKSNSANARNCTRKVLHLQTELVEYTKRNKILNENLIKCVSQPKENQTVLQIQLADHRQKLILAENDTLTLRANLSATIQRCSELEQKCTSENLQSKLSTALLNIRNLTKQLRNENILKNELQHEIDRRLKLENRSEELRQKKVELTQLLFNSELTSQDLKDNFKVMEQKYRRSFALYQECRNETKQSICPEDCDYCRKDFDEEKKQSTKLKKQLRTLKKELGGLKVDFNESSELLSECKTELEALKGLKSTNGKLVQKMSIYEEQVKQLKEKLELEKTMRLKSEGELSMVKQELNRTKSDLVQARLSSMNQFQNKKETEDENRRCSRKETSLNCTHQNQSTSCKQVIKNLGIQLKEKEKQSMGLLKQLQQCLNETVKRLKDADKPLVNGNGTKGCSGTVRLTKPRITTIQDSHFITDCSRGPVCFLFSLKKATYYEAFQSCRSRKGKLASVQSADENEWISRRAKAINAISWYIGPMRSRGNNFANQDGSPICYRNFDTNQPDNWGGHENCVHFRADSNKWNDINCGSRFRYICEVAWNQ